MTLLKHFIERLRYPGDELWTAKPNSGRLEAINGMVMYRWVNGALEFRAPSAAEAEDYIASDGW